MWLWVSKVIRVTLKMGQALVKWKGPKKSFGPKMGCPNGQALNQRSTPPVHLPVPFFGHFPRRALPEATLAVAEHDMCSSVLPMAADSFPEGQDEAEAGSRPKSLRDRRTVCCPLWGRFFFFFKGVCCCFWLAHIFMSLGGLF